MWSSRFQTVLYICRYKSGVPVDPLSTPGKYKIENKYGVHSLIISRYELIRTIILFYLTKWKYIKYKVWLLNKETEAVIQVE